MFGKNRKKNPSSCACWTKRLAQVSKYHLKIQKIQKQWIRKILSQWHFKRTECDFENFILVIKCKNYLENVYCVFCCIFCFIIWPVRPCAQFPWKTIREKVPYENRTRRSDRAGKTHTALLGMAAAKSRVNDKKQFFCCQSLFSPKWVKKVKHSESELYYPGELSHAELLHQSLTHTKTSKAKKES